MKNLDSLLDARAKKLGIDNKNQEFPELAAKLVKQRFYYQGYSHYSARDNAIIYLLGRWIWIDLSAVVIPDDILKYPYAACSQQSIVLMELLKNNGYDVRKIGLKYHFALEAGINGNWKFYDPTFELNISDSNSRRSFKSFIKDKEYLFKVYEHNLDSTDVKLHTSHFTIGNINEFPAKKIRIVHEIAKFYMDYILYITGLFSLFFVIILIQKKDFTIRQNN
jgi:hypothetical protein